jgi:hypothetical protein
MTQAPTARATLSPTEAFEALILLSHTLSQTVEASDILASRNLSLDAFAMLVTIAGEAGTPGVKIAKRAAPLGKASRVARNSLLSAGLIEKSPDGGARSYVSTAKGLETLAEIRAAGGEAAKGMTDRALRAVPRVASIVRDLVQEIRPPRKARGEGDQVAA